MADNRAQCNMAGCSMPYNYPLYSPSVGPNMVFHINHPQGMLVPPPCQHPPPPPSPPKKEKKEEKPEEKGEKKEGKEGPKPPQKVQGNPTWQNPRLLNEKGKPLKQDPCIIQ
ncbi:hypothetical protein BDB01DRAFT_832334 [Pilobolus umbonatus]|nr:hypothetical protein BDB01DRAFT_832334 [Pilobolus umbonatus]